MKHTIANMVFWMLVSIVASGCAAQFGLFPISFALCVVAIIFMFLALAKYLEGEKG